MKKMLYLLLSLALLGACNTPKNAPLTSNNPAANMEVTNLSPAQYQAQAAQQPGLLLDVRTPGEYAGGHLSDAQNLDWLGGQFAAQVDGLDKNKTYYLYCASGNRSGQASRMMLEKGFTKVYNIGGYAALAQAGIQ